MGVAIRMALIQRALAPEQPPKSMLPAAKVVVTEGVAPNERIVLAGQMLVRPGGKVRIDSSSASAPASNASGKTTQNAGGQS